MTSTQHKIVRRRRRRRSNSPVAESIIHTWVGEVQFNRGLGYVDLKLVGHTHRRGSLISARCGGKSNDGQVYQVQAEVDEGRIESATCTCSIGKYGVCPHIAAMLIEYSRRSEKFTPHSWWGWFKQWLPLRGRSGQTTLASEE